MRTTTNDAGMRAQNSFSRGTLRKADDNHHWQEIDVDVGASETHTGIERAQTYGFTNYPADQDEDEQKQQGKQGGQDQGGGGGGGDGGGPEMGEQPQGDAAEVMIAYLNGSRSHPVAISIDDRRHRLKELEAGDTAFYRLKDDRQQMLMHKDGTYISTRDDKVMRMALVPKQKKDQQQQQQGPQQAGGQQKKQQKEYGQKSARDDNKKSEVVIEQNGKEIFTRHKGELFNSVRGDSDASMYQEDRKKSHQTTEEHNHMRFKFNWIWNDKDGNWMMPPLLVKKDNFCKE